MSYPSPYHVYGILIPRMLGEGSAIANGASRVSRSERIQNWPKQMIHFCPKESIIYLFRPLHVSDVDSKVCSRNPTVKRPLHFRIYIYGKACYQTEGNLVVCAKPNSMHHIQPNTWS